MTTVMLPDSITRPAPRALWLAIVASLMAGCEGPPLQNGFCGPLQEYPFRTPRRCTAHGPAYEQPVRTERSAVPAYLGYVYWNAREGMMLDLDRYGTILEIDLQQIVGRNDAPRWRPAGMRRYPTGEGRALPFEVWHVAGAIEAVLKGGRGLELGAVEFPATAYYRRGSGLRLQLPDLSGGWLTPLVADADRADGWAIDTAHPRPVVPGHALVFLPPAEVYDARDIGCVEGHVIATDTDGGQRYLEDVRRVTQLMPLVADGVLPPGAAHDLLDQGGLTAGYYVAEHANWRAAVDLLPPVGAVRSPVPASQLGLVEGLLRMRHLVTSGHYSAPGWAHVDWARVDRALLSWAIAVLAAHDSEDTNAAKSAAYALAGGVCRGTVSEVSELRLRPDLVARAAKWLVDPLFGGVLDQPSFEDLGVPFEVNRPCLQGWLVGDRAPAYTPESHEIPLWFYFPGSTPMREWSESEALYPSMTGCCGASCARSR